MQTFKGLIYLDIDHPLVAWECYRGTLISPRVNSLNYPSIRLANIIRSSDNINLANELLFESIRAKEFPLQVSRLRCLYVFKDISSAKKAGSWGEHFNKDTLVEIGIGATTCSRCDINWIEMADRETNGLIKPNYIDSIRKYWAQEPYNEEPQWEYLIDGHAIIWGTEHKERAYNLIRDEMPNALGLLELSRMAETIGSNLGHIYPAIARLSNTSFKLSHVVDMKDFKSKAFWKKMEEHPGPVNLHDLKEFGTKGSFTVPDLRKYEKKFTISKSKLYSYSSMKIHS